MPITNDISPGLAQSHSRTDGHFDTLAAQVQRHFAAIQNSATSNRFLFTVKPVDDLYEAYLIGFKQPGAREHHACNCCKQFIERFGNLVTIDEDGRLHSALWSLPEAAIPEIYRPSITMMCRAVERGIVNGVFVTADRVWGNPTAGVDPNTGKAWTHFSVKPAATVVFHDRLLTPYQWMAARKEDFRTLTAGLQDYGLLTLRQAQQVLASNAVLRGEKFTAPVEWWVKLQTARVATRDSSVKRNLVWRAIANAPAGWATPRSSVIGTMLDDIVAGKSFEAIKGAFEQKVDPVNFMRAKAAPTAGNLARAEEIVARLNLAPALERRFARLDDLEAIWRKPELAAAAPNPGEVFGHLKPKSKAAPTPNLALPPQAMTWVLFAREVLPDASKIEVYIEPRRPMNFVAFTAAVHPEAEPLLQWDDPNGRRNTVAWYVYRGGSPATQWGLSGGNWVDVPAVTLAPHQWHGRRSSNHTASASFILAGAVDTNDAGLGLFAETLRGELHEIRSTIEAFSQSGQLAGRDSSAACGVIVDGSLRFRVTTAFGTREYTIDRWE